MEERATQAMRTAAEMLTAGKRRPTVVRAVRGMGFGLTSAEMIVTMAGALRAPAPWL